MDEQENMLNFCQCCDCNTNYMEKPSKYENCNIAKCTSCDFIYHYVKNPTKRRSDARPSPKSSLAQAIKI